MKSIVYLVLALLIGLSPLTAQQDASLVKLLERAEASLYGSGMTQLEFSTQLVDSRDKDQGKTRGHMYLQGEAFRLEYGTITAVYSAGTLSYYDKAEQTLTHSKPSEEELMQINPLRFLRSRAQGFTSSYVVFSTESALLRFIPKASSNVSSILVKFLMSNAQPTRLTFIARDGSRLTAEVGKPVRKPAAPARFFTLSERNYPGCEVIDLR